jgi:serine/threonine-protein kinase RsbW
VPALPGQAATPRAAAPYAARFGAGDLRRVRRAVAEWAVRAGLRGRRAGDFLIAVNQVASSAVWRGSPLARLKLQVAGGTVALAEVRDSGHPPPGPPAAPAPGGLATGLQVARRICDEVTIRRSPKGSTVTLCMSLPGQDEARPHG